MTRGSHQFKQVVSQILNDWPSTHPTEVLKRNILKLSNLYKSDNIQGYDIWSNPDLTDAYLAYFTPLNILRSLAVLQEAKDCNFFSGLNRIIDFGSGPGTLDIALAELNIYFSRYHFIESGPKAIDQHKKLLSALKLNHENKTWSNTADSTFNKAAAHSLASFSYSLNEVAELPEWAFQQEALLIIEPSTQEHGRNLQMLRQKLIAKGFSIWAPCTHQDSCPLLTQSKTDWCHNRIHIELPEALQFLETGLPIKNQTLTYSYLLARKTPRTQPAEEARVIGDTLYERGKIKQAICRGPKREFLSWLKRHGEPTPIARGTRLPWPYQDAEQKGDEWRVTD